MTLQLIAQAFSLFVGLFSYRRQSISKSGLGALLLVSGLFIWLDQLPALVIVFSMFASSSLLSKYKKAQKEKAEKVVAKSGPRDWVQAVCNLGVATAMMLAYEFTGEQAFLVGLVGSVASANADSWASEIGGLSKSKPVLITNFKPVQAGISGGITLLGTFGGILGSLFIAGISVLFFGYQIALIGFLAGIAGLFFDSYLGAWFQALYVDEAGNVTENKTGKLTKGFTWMDNDVVNFMATLFGGVVAGFIVCSV